MNAAYFNYDSILWDESVPGKRVNYGLRNFLVVDSTRARELNIQFGDDGLHPDYAGGSTLRHDFFRVTGDMAGKSDDSLFDSNANRGGIYARFTGELIFDVLSQPRVRLHLASPRLAEESYRGHVPPCPG